ncbi:hypothetical protein BJ170DRAFT_598147 [Xylariales sp. AK1849]|nr:hypothetical protein BJ170DRAFT_598147 [Xylariales sp. AK1849]
MPLAPGSQPLLFLRDGEYDDSEFPYQLRIQGCAMFNFDFNKSYKCANKLSGLAIRSFPELKILSRTRRFWEHLEFSKIIAMPKARKEKTTSATAEPISDPGPDPAPATKQRNKETTKRADRVPNLVNNDRGEEVWQCPNMKADGSICGSKVKPYDQSISSHMAKMHKNGSRHQKLSKQTPKVPCSKCDSTSRNFYAFLRHHRDVHDHKGDSQWLEAEWEMALEWAVESEEESDEDEDEEIDEDDHDDDDDDEN